MLVEKYFKAYLTFRDIRITKTHDMELLLDMCIKLDKDFSFLDQKKIARLTFYAVEVRYPDDFYLPSIEEAKESIKIAKEVRELVKRKIRI